MYLRSWVSYTGLILYFDPCKTRMEVKPWQNPFEGRVAQRVKGVVDVYNALGVVLAYQSSALGLKL